MTVARLHRSSNVRVNDGAPRLKAPLYRNRKSMLYCSALYTPHNHKPIYLMSASLRSELLFWGVLRISLRATRRPEGACSAVWTVPNEPCNPIRSKQKDEKRKLCVSPRASAIDAPHAQSLISHARVIPDSKSAGHRRGYLPEVGQLAQIPSRRHGACASRSPPWPWLRFAGRRMGGLNLV